MRSGDPVTRLTLDNFDGLAGLAGLADRTGMDIRPILLRVLTDLYIQKPSHTPAEERHYVELALRLIEVVDAATCATVAGKLAGYRGAPAAVVARLHKAAPHMASQTVNNGHDKSGTVELWLNEDADIFEPLPEQIVEAPKAAAVQPAVQPASAPLTFDDPDYIGQRESFFDAGSEERRLILQNLSFVAEEQSMALAAGTNVVRYLEQAALAGRSQEFTTLLQQSLGTSRGTTARIITDPLGEPFVVSARALAMPADVFQRILMFLNPAIGHSVDKVYELSDLFLDLPLSSALHLVAVWRAADREDARIAIHRPVHWDSAAHKRDAAKPVHQAGRPAGTTVFGRRSTGI